MNLRVIHLLRKVERIDRDIEELDALLSTLQMDREYSARLRDSLIEESFRLRQLKQRIHSQVIRIPPHLENLLADGRRTEIPPTVTAHGQKTQEDAASDRPDHKQEEARPVLSSESEIKISPSSKKDPSSRAEIEKMSSVPVRNSSGEKKKPPFLFRFE